MSETFETLKNLILDVVDVDQVLITPEASLSIDIGMDSLDDVELLMRAEEEFGVELDDAELEKVLTVADAIALIERSRA